MADIVIGNKTKNVNVGVFIQGGTTAIDPIYWYSEIFGRVPTYRCICDIMKPESETDDETDVFTDIYNELINNGFTPVTYSYDYNGDDKIVYSNNFTVVHETEPIMVSYFYGDLKVMSHIGIDVINKVVKEHIDKFNHDEKKPKCYLIVREHYFDLREFNVNVDSNSKIDFDLYNDGFENVHNSIVKSIKTDKNGLYLLYGKPGTGKSTYIRHIINECGNDKMKFIYVPSNLFGDFTDTSFLPFLLDQKGSVFIIEDCESLVTNVDGIRSDALTDLLNMTDGLLGDALNIKIICTFNIDDGKIDEALLRPGRCKCKYEFDLLNKDKANEVAKKMNLKEVDKDVSLADLFNSGETYLPEKKKKMGFR